VNRDRGGGAPAGAPGMGGMPAGFGGAGGLERLAQTPQMQELRRVSQVSIYSEIDQADLLDCTREPTVDPAFTSADRHFQPPARTTHQPAPRGTIRALGRRTRR
jgi:hypothetical protein